MSVIVEGRTKLTYDEYWLVDTENHTDQISYGDATVDLTDVWRRM